MTQAASTEKEGPSSHKRVRRLASELQYIKEGWKAPLPFAKHLLDVDKVKALRDAVSMMMQKMVICRYRCPCLAKEKVTDTQTVKCLSFITTCLKPFVLQT